MTSLKSSWTELLKSTVDNRLLMFLFLHFGLSGKTVLEYLITVEVNKSLFYNKRFRFRKGVNSLYHVSVAQPYDGIVYVK